MDSSSPIHKDKNQHPYVKLGERSIFATVSEFDGQLKVHVRWYTSPVGDCSTLIPTTRGIALSPAEFDELIRQTPIIHQWINEASSPPLTTPMLKYSTPPSSTIPAARITTSSLGAIPIPSSTITSKSTNTAVLPTKEKGKRKRKSFLN